MPDKLRGEEVLCLAGLCNMEAVESPLPCGQSAVGFMLMISASAPAVCGRTQEHFGVSRKKGRGYERRNKWVSRTAIFSDLQAGVSASLFAEAAGDAGAAGRTFPYKYVFACRENPGIQYVLGGTETLRMHTCALSAPPLALSLAFSLSRSISLNLSLPQARSLSLSLAHPLNTQVTTYFVNDVYCTESSMLKCPAPRLTSGSRKSEKKGLTVTPYVKVL